MRSWAQCYRWFEHVSEFRGVGVIVWRSWCCVCLFFLSSVILAVRIVAPRRDAQLILWRGRKGAPRWPQKAIWYRSQGAVVSSRENTSTTL